MSWARFLFVVFLFVFLGLLASQNLMPECASAEDIGRFRWLWPPGIPSVLVLRDSPTDSILGTVTVLLPGSLAVQIGQAVPAGGEMSADQPDTLIVRVGRPIVIGVWNEDEQAMVEPEWETLEEPRIVGTTQAADSLPGLDENGETPAR